jgi:isoleucyl-tRNA synthetase
LHKGAKPVHWCCDCGSALAEAEVEYEDKTSPAIDVRFAVLDDEALFERCHHVPAHEGEGPLSVIIWTTTPWTLPANQAVALNPEYDYVVVQCQTAQGVERLLLAQLLLKDTMLRYGIDEYRVLAYASGKALEGLKLQHPFYEREVPVIVGEHVTADAGTGAVHTAPGHGQDDYVVGQRYGLPVENPVDGNGCFMSDTPLFGGQHVFSANDEVIETMKARGSLVHEAALRHSYPHCWRHKTPIIFRATPQWFISMEQKGLRVQALDNIQQVRWLPDWGQARIEGMIEKRPDWCISRQRTWGVPIPLFVHKQSGHLHERTAELIEAVAKRVEVDGIDAWFELEAGELIGAEAEHYDKVIDTLDVWFDSGVTHFAVLRQNEVLSFPADLYLEGSDQHRGWFQSSLLTSVAMNGLAPYKTVLTHGFTVDAEGRKMSKSIGNVVAPQKIFNSLGADILRLWVASTDYSGEMTVSDEILKRSADAYRRMRNTARFLLANLNGFIPEHDLVPRGDMLALDRWALTAAHELQQKIINAYHEYAFHRVYQLIHNFCAIEMGSFYLDIIKDRQYTTQTDSLARRSAQTAMYHIVEALVRWLMPVLSFTAEDIWQHIPGQRGDSVLLEEWHAIPEAKEEVVGEIDWQQIIGVREAVSKELEKLRVAGDIGSSLAAEVDLYCDAELFAELDRFGGELRFVLITSYARIHLYADKPENAVDIVLNNGDKNLAILANSSRHNKCVRCWHQRDDVGSHEQHPELCGRCVENVAGAGEQRQFA